MTVFRVKGYFKTEQYVEFDVEAESMEDFDDRRWDYKLADMAQEALYGRFDPDHIEFEADFIVEQPPEGEDADGARPEADKA